MVFATKTGTDALKTVTKNVAHKAAKATGEFTGNKIANKTLKSKRVPNVKSKNFEEIIVPPEKGEEIFE